MGCTDTGLIFGNAPPGTQGGADFALFRDERAGGTLGDVIAAATWTRRVLQTTVYNDVVGAALRVDNGVDLAAGTYIVWAWGVANNAACVNHRLRIVDGGGVELARGVNWRDGNGASQQLAAVHAARVVMAAAGIVYVEHYSLFGGGAGALGAPLTDGGVEVYCELLIRTYS